MSTVEAANGGHFQLSCLAIFYRLAFASLVYRPFMFSNALSRQRPKDRAHKRGFTRPVLAFQAPIAPAKEKVESLSTK